MSRKRRPLSLKSERDPEAKLEAFVLNGIDSFKNTKGEPAWSHSPLIWVELERILLPQFQLRVYFDRNKIEQIKATIKSVGIKEPLLLRPHPEKEGYFELVAGSQRRLSALELDYSPVSAKVDEVDDLTALKIALIENEARSNINPYEKARGTVRLLELGLKETTEEVLQTMTAMFNAENRGADNNVIITPEVRDFIIRTFDETGLSWKSFVTNQMPLFKLPEEVKKVLERGQLEYTKAVEIAKMKDEGLRQQLLEQALAEKLSLKQIKEQIAQLQPRKQKSEAMILRDRVQTALKKATSSKLMKDPAVVEQVRVLAEQLEALVKQTKRG